MSDFTASARLLCCVCLVLCVCELHLDETGTTSTAQKWSIMTLWCDIMTTTHTTKKKKKRRQTECLIPKLFWLLLFSKLFDKKTWDNNYQTHCTRLSDIKMWQYWASRKYYDVKASFFVFVVVVVVVVAFFFLFLIDLCTKVLDKTSWQCSDKNSIVSNCCYWERKIK